MSSGSDYILPKFEVGEGQDAHCSDPYKTYTQEELDILVPYNRGFLEGHIYDVPQTTLGSQWSASELANIDPALNVESINAYWLASQSPPMLNGPIGPNLNDLLQANNVFESTYSAPNSSSPVAQGSDDAKRLNLSRTWRTKPPAFIPPPTLTSKNSRRVPRQYATGPTALPPLRVKMDPLSHGGKGFRKRSLACIFCRARKITCGRPDYVDVDQTCNQCVKRGLKCEYPSGSRRNEAQKQHTSEVSKESDGEGQSGQVMRVMEDGTEA